MSGQQPTERGAVVDMAWQVRGGSVRLSLHTMEPLSEFDVQQLGEVVRRIETLTHVLDVNTDAAAAADILAAD